MLDRKGSSWRRELLKRAMLPLEILGVHAGEDVKTTLSDRGDSAKGAPVEKERIVRIRRFVWRPAYSN